MKRHRRIPADAGLQSERTELSWRRTLLALTIASIASARILHPLLGTVALIIGAAGFTLAAVVAVVSRHRFARMHAWFTAHHSQARATPPSSVISGRTLLTLSAFLSIGSALILAQVLLL